MNRNLFASITVLCLLGMASAASAQAPQTAAPMDRFVDIKDAANQHTYEDVARLNKAHCWFLPSGVSERMGGPNYTELTHMEFVRSIVRGVHGLGMDPAELAELRSRQDLQESLLRLIEVFRSDLTALGCDPSALRMQVVRQGRVPATALGEPSPSSFPDVPRRHWAFGSVETLRQTGILVGFPGHKFFTANPQMPMWLGQQGVIDARHKRDR